jgi:putative transposase
LFVDGIAERADVGQPREPVLAAWGILADGKKALLHLAPAPRKTPRAAGNSSTTCAGAACRSAVGDQRQRARHHPRDRRVFPARAAAALPGAQDARNLASKVPEDLWPEFKARAAACYQAASPALARLLRDDIRTTYGHDLPSAVACLEDDFEACIAHMRFPLGHRRAVRTTNLLERLFGEERRRTKVIPHAFGERAVLKLIYAALIRATERWRGLRITEFEQRQLKAIHDEIDKDFAARNAPAATASQPHLSSNQRT